jgi:tRNA(Arg) A34 adenosine deaminase TadA
MSDARAGAPGPGPDLADGWRAAFEQAWGAYRAGTMPIGAAIVDARGRVVAADRNRIYDRPDQTPAGRLAGSRLAHAEVNCLLQLPLTPEARFPDHTLLTTTEPCLLCAGAVTMVRIGALHFAAGDAVAGSAYAIATGTPYLERIDCRVEGPRPDRLGAFARLLVEEQAWRTKPDGLVERVCRELHPDVAEVVEDVLRANTLAAAATLDDALDAVSPALDRLAPRLGA